MKRATSRAGLAELLVGGASANQLAWTIAIGFAAGCFPLIGLSTIACVAIAWALRLKQAPIQLGNYGATPFQIALVIPYLRLGESLFRVEHMSLAPQQLIHIAQTRNESAMRAVVMRQWYMIVAWAISVPVLMLFAYAVSRPLMNRVQRQELQRAA